MSNASSTIISDVPPGIYLDFAGSSAPDGYLLCDGSTVSKTLYPRLFEIIGYTYGGSGDNFKLPDFRGRTSIGSGTGVGLTSRVVGTTVGAETHVLTESEMPSHTHTQNSHSHGMKSTRLDSSGSSEYIERYTYAPPSVWNNTEPTVATNQNTGGGQAHNNMQPFIVLNKIVRF